MMKKFRMPTVAMIVAVYFSLFVGSPAVAGLIASAPSAAETGQKVRADEINQIQKVLESQILTEKLMAYGLSSEEVKLKLQSMSDEQIHLLAQASDRVLAGGDGLGIVIGLLVILILVILVVKLLDKTVVIK